MQTINNKAFLELKSALESQEPLDLVKEKAHQVLSEAYANRLSRAELLALKPLSDRIASIRDSISDNQNNLNEVIKSLAESYLDPTEKIYRFEKMHRLLEGLPHEESKNAFKKSFENLSNNFYSYMLEELIPLVCIFPNREERIECLEKSILFDRKLRIEYGRSKSKTTVKECFSTCCKKALSLLSTISEPKLKLPILKSFMLLSVHKIMPTPTIPDIATGLICLLNTLPSEKEKLDCLQKLDTFHERHLSCSLNCPGMLDLLTQTEQDRWDEFLEAAGFMGGIYNPMEGFGEIFSNRNKWYTFSELILSLYKAAAELRAVDHTLHVLIRYTFFHTIKEDISDDDCHLFSDLLKPLSISDLFDSAIHVSNQFTKLRAYNLTLRTLFCLFSTFAKMLPDEKTLFLRIRDALLKEGMSNFEILEISLDLLDMPLAKRLQFSQEFNATATNLPLHAISPTLKIKAYFHSHPKEYDDLLRRVPADQLEAFFKNMAHLLQDIGNNEFTTDRFIFAETLSNILEKFKKIDPSQWGNFSTGLFIPEEIIKDHKKFIVDSFASIDPVNWAPFSKIIHSLLRGETFAAQNDLIRRLTTNISQKNWQPLSDLIDISTTQMLSEIKKRLESAFSIEYLLEGAKLCLRPGITDHQKQAITNHIIEAHGKQDKFPNREANEKLERLRSYIKPEMTAEEILAFLPFIANANLWKLCKTVSNKNLVYIFQATALCLRPEMTDAEVESILKSLSQDPQEKLERLQSYIQPEMTTQEILFCLPFISDQMLWERYTSTIDPVLKKGFSLSLLSKRFKTTGPSEQLELFSLIGPYMEGGTRNQLMQAMQAFEPICFYKRFADAAILEARSLTSPEIDHSTFLSLTGQAFYNAVLSYLTACTKSTTLNWKTREYALMVAKALLKDQNFSELKENDPLKQAIIQTILWLTGDKYEPNYVHAHLIAVRSSGSTPIRENIKPAPVIISDPFCKVSLKLDFVGIQKGLQKIHQKEKSAEELQAWIEQVNQTKLPDSPLLGPNVFVDLFDSLTKRLEITSPKDPALQAAVKQTADWLTNPQFLCRRLLQKDFENSTPSEQKLLIRLYEIAAAILRKSNTLAPKQFLSPREDAMMTWLRLIEQCSTGQEEGIHVCYNSLRVSGEIECKVEKTSILPGSEKTENFLALEVQKVMEDVMALPATLKLLGVTCKRALKQMVHQTRYMRGILALVYEDCGLDYPVEVDPNGGTVSRELMARSREIILEVIFRQTTKHIIPSLKIDINSRLFDDKLYDNINMFLVAHGVTDTRQIWKIGEEGVVELSDFGAITLLEKGEYLHANLGSYKHYLELQSQIEETEKELHTLRNANPIDPKIIEEAKAHLATSEKAMVRAIRSNDSNLESIKENHRKAKEEYEKLLTKDQSVAAALKRANSLKSLISSLGKQLSEVRIRLEGEALQEEVLPPIPVIQERLIEGNLPADIQFLEDRWKTAKAQADAAAGNEAAELQKAAADRYKQEYETAVHRYQRHL